MNDCWQEIPVHFPQIVLHEYVIMPNHVHGIIEINNPQSTGANMGMCTDTVGVEGVSKVTCPLLTLTLFEKNHATY